MTDQLREILRSLRRAHKLLVERGEYGRAGDVRNIGYRLTGDLAWYETGRKITLTGREP